MNINLMTIPAAAAAGVLPESALRRLKAEGRLPGVQVGNRFYVNLRRLEELVDQVPGEDQCREGA